MKVILLQDVAKIGRRFAVVEVPDGYAHNQLIPKRMAEPATPANLKRVQKMHTEVKANNDANQQRFLESLATLTATTIAVPAEANEVGHLFKAVNANDIAEAAKSAGIQVDVAMIITETPIKDLGEHSVGLVCGNSKDSFTVNIIKK